ncbi:MAG: hypothetical protein AABM66_02105 [Actinomycetota bacterium]
MRRIRRHLTFANVVSVIALFVALSGGTAVALSGSNTVFTDDIANDTQPAGGGNPAGGLAAADLRPNSVGGSEVANGSIAGADIAPSALPFGRKITSSCDPSSTTYVDCGTLTINLPRSGLRVLIIASAMWYNDAPGGSAGVCRIGVNGAPFGPNAFPGEGTDSTGNIVENSLTLTNVTDPNLGAGNHTFGLACNQWNGDIKFNPTYVSVVVLGPG